jgi:hypothetical protein
MQVSLSYAPLRRSPAHEAPLETELLYGEYFTRKREERVGDSLWYYGRRDLDGYEGYISASRLVHTMIPPTHRVSSVRTICYRSPDVKSKAGPWYSMNARGTASTVKDGFTRLNGVWVPSKDLAALDAPAKDPATEAEKLIGTPYLWGGFDTNRGVDCSAVIQHAFLACGKVVPRDSGPQSKSVGTPIEFTKDLKGLRRNDLVFWEGHVGIMLDESRLLHATAARMRVVVENVYVVAKERLEKGKGPVTAVRRVG